MYIKLKPDSLWLRPGDTVKLYNYFTIMLIYIILSFIYEFPMIISTSLGGAVAGRPTPQPSNTLFAALRRIDATYTINTEREFQIRNKKARKSNFSLPGYIR